MKGMENLPLTKKNYQLMLIGAGIIILGFILMVGGGSEDPLVFNAEELFSFRRITLAPIVVIFGFAFEIYAIMKKTDEKEDENIATAKKTANKATTKTKK
ncbi:MAG: DUF3098 domain-containing protein [Rikenellaceae bacterium]